MGLGRNNVEMKFQIIKKINRVIKNHSDRGVLQKKKKEKRKKNPQHVHVSNDRELNQPCISAMSVC